MCVCGYATYSYFVNSKLELIILFPENIQVRHRNAYGSLICLAKHIHLLHVLPAFSIDLAWPALDELDVVVPHLARIPVVTNVVQHKLVRLVHNLARLAGAIV